MKKKKQTVSATTKALQSIQRAWHRAQLKKARKDVKNMSATPKQHEDALARFRKSSNALERMKGDGPKKKRGKKGKR